MPRKCRNAVYFLLLTSYSIASDVQLAGKELVIKLYKYFEYFNTTALQFFRSPSVYPKKITFYSKKDLFTLLSSLALVDFASSFPISFLQHIKLEKYFTRLLVVIHARFFHLDFLDDEEEGKKEVETKMLFFPPSFPNNRPYL